MPRSRITMRSIYYLLTSLPVLGFASAQVFPREIDPTKPNVDNNLSGEQSWTQEGPTQTTNVDNTLFHQQLLSQDGQGNFVLDGNERNDGNTTLLGTATEIRQYLVSKLREIYRMLEGRKTKVDIEQATLLDFEHLPKFEDPLYVGNFTKKYKFADVSFANVEVHGMNNFHLADVHTDLKERTVHLQLAVESLRISGDYFLSNYFKKTSGPFTVNLVDNVTYHESSVYCRLKQELDIAASQCSVRYGKSENDYANLGFFTQLFRGPISNPMIDEALQKVGKEIGHKMRPILLTKLRETVMGRNNSAVVVPGLETLIRSTVSELRNLMMKDEYKNVKLLDDVKKVQYGTYVANIQTIDLSSINTFEITALEFPILEDKIAVNLTLHDTNVNGSTNIVFTENNTLPKANGPTNIVLPFDIGDFEIGIALEKHLSNDAERFAITHLSVSINKITTYPRQDSTYSSEIEAALRESLPTRLQSIITERFTSLVRLHVENILQEVL